MLGLPPPPRRGIFLPVPLHAAGISPVRSGLRRADPPQSYRWTAAAPAVSRPRDADDGPAYLSVLLDTPRRSEPDPQTPFAPRVSYPTPFRLG